MSDVPPIDTDNDTDEPDDITVIEIQEEMESSFLDYADCCQAAEKILQASKGGARAGSGTPADGAAH